MLLLLHKRENIIVRQDSFFIARCDHLNRYSEACKILLVLTEKEYLSEDPFCIIYVREIEKREIVY